MSETSLFVQRVGSLYERPHSLNPFVGKAFLASTSELARIVVVGINSYVSSKDWVAAGEPGGRTWFPQWFAKREYRFYMGVASMAEELVEGLRAPGLLLSGKACSFPESYYATNAIKAFLPEASGKRAQQLDAALFAEHYPTWQAELDLMAELDVLPDVIIVFGRPFWADACRSFRSESQPAYQHLQLQGYQHTSGPSLHFVNRLRLGNDRGSKETLLVRMRHPAGRTAKGSPTWLLQHKDFRSLATQKP